MNKGGKNPKVSFGIRIIAGGYVIYLAISSVRLALKEGTTMDMPMVIAIAALLTVVGAIFLINGLQGYRQLKKLEEAEAEEEAQEQEPEEGSEAEEIMEKPVPKSSGLMSKAVMPAHLQVSEDEEEDSDAEA